MLIFWNVFEKHISKIVHHPNDNFKQGAFTTTVFSDNRLYKYVFPKQITYKRIAIGGILVETISFSFFQYFPDIWSAFRFNFYV